MNSKKVKKKKLIKKRDNDGKNGKKCDIDCIIEDGNFDKSLLSSLMNGFLKVMTLWIITQERIHGYEIIKKMKDGTEDLKEDIEFKGPGPNKIYPILHELEKKDLIKGDWELQGKRKIKFYEATEKGKNTIEIMRKKPHKNVPPVIREFWNDVMVSHKSHSKHHHNHKSHSNSNSNSHRFHE